VPFSLYAFYSLVTLKGHGRLNLIQLVTAIILSGGGYQFIKYGSIVAKGRGWIKSYVLLAVQMGLLFWPLGCSVLLGRDKGLVPVRAGHKAKMT
jgi:hypothetical protein